MKLYLTHNHELTTDKSLAVAEITMDASVARAITEQYEKENLILDIQGEIMQHPNGDKLKDLDEKQMEQLAYSVQKSWENNDDRAETYWMVIDQEIDELLKKQSK